MMFNFFKVKPPVEAILSMNQRLYCVGDIHGRDDLLINIHGQIAEDLQSYQDDITIVYVGDYIDRGMNSRQVLDRLVTKHFLSEYSVFLRGNHEQVLLNFLEDDRVGPTWLTFGGHATLTSYGVALAKIPTKRQDYIEIQQGLRENLPDAHLQFLRETLFCYQAGTYFFAHAGINPKYSIDRQNTDDLMWVREKFTSSKNNFDKIIVHGHSITDQAEFKTNRIGIDTGAYASGVLTCLVLEGKEQRLLQTSTEMFD